MDTHNSQLLNLIFEERKKETYTKEARRLL
jgi:hypothetical protein